MQYLKPIQARIEGQIDYSKKRKNELKQKKTSHCKLVESLVELTLKEFNATDIQFIEIKDKPILQFKANVTASINLRDIQNEIKKSGGYAVDRVNISRI